MPSVDGLAGQWAGSVDVMAVAWQSGWDETRAAAGKLLRSGWTRWTLDGEAAEAFGVASQPVSVLIADGREVRRWYGPIGGEVVGLVRDLTRT